MQFLSPDGNFAVLLFGHVGSLGTLTFAAQIFGRFLNKNLLRIRIQNLIGENWILILPEGNEVD